jgi:hypothetical protein
MALYTILRIYEVPAENRIQATDRMMEALAFHVEKDFHVKDVIREPGKVSAIPWSPSETTSTFQTNLV